VEFNRVKRRRDTALRELLGFSDSDYVFLAVGESTRGGGASGCGVGDVNPSRRAIRSTKCSRGAVGRRSIGRTFGAERHAGAVRIAEERLGAAVEFEELLPAADMLLVPARAAPWRRCRLRLRWRRRCRSSRR
jgi:hypothetical protein